MKDVLLQVSGSRRSFYEMLSSLYYRELTEQQIEGISKIDFVELCSDDELMIEGAEEMNRFFRTSLGDTRLDLAVDYAHSILAAGTYNGTRAVPYESVYTSDEGLLMQEARDDVYRIFCEERLGVREGIDVPDDHLSFEFDFMAEMCARFDESLSEGDMESARASLDRQSLFHENHLANWIDAFCDTLDSVAQTDFYRGVSKLTRAWVHLEAETIADMRDALDGVCLPDGR